LYDWTGRTGTFGTEGEQYIIELLKNKKDLSGIIFEDYNKGTLTERLIRSVLSFAKKSIYRYLLTQNLIIFLLLKAQLFLNPTGRKQHRVGY